MVVDFIAIPFVVSPEDVTFVKGLLGPYGGTVKLLAKIDTKEGVQAYP